MLDLFLEVFGVLKFLWKIHETDIPFCIFKCSVYFSLLGMHFIIGVIHVYAFLSDKLLIVEISVFLCRYRWFPQPLISMPFSGKPLLKFNVSLKSF
jgi:hypothetical protein